MAYVPKVLVFGHSFVKRLKQRTEAEPLKFKPDLDLKQCRVVFKGFGGLNLGIADPVKKTYFYRLESLCRSQADQDSPGVQFGKQWNF